MSRKRFSPEQIIGKLREVEVALAQAEVAIIQEGWLDREDLLPQGQGGKIFWPWQMWTDGGLSCAVLPKFGG